MAAGVISEAELREESGGAAATAPQHPQADPVQNPSQAQAERTKQRAMSFWETIQKGSDDDIAKRYAEDMKEVAGRHASVTANYYCLALLEPNSSIDDYELDRIYNALAKANSNRERDILLVLLSPGGQIEPAYQISKLCKSYAREKFVVVVPRQAKSAATLVALGADEIHMGPLGQLGPIDPQLGGLPALGVSQALNRIAAVAQQYPKSADMLARYLRSVLSVEQIGYCERISESAEQYAQRLLSRKPQLEKSAATIAHDLVHTYKDHSFVIDLDEAREHLGTGWVKDSTEELRFVEEVYENFRLFNLFLSKKHMVVVGDLIDGAIVWPKPD
jgi:ClpP class serine protease